MSSKQAEKKHRPTPLGDRRKALAPVTGAGKGSAGNPASPVKTAVLIIEEDDRMRSLVVSCFEQIGCIVHAAGGLARGLEAAREATLDVAVVSEELLAPDRVAACRALRAASGRDRLPIVLTGSEDAPGTPDLYRTCGCADYVARSASQMELVRRVANLLQIPPRRFLRTMVAQVRSSPRSRAEYLGHSRDISCTGILIETTRPLGVDEVLPIKFLLPHSNSLITVVSRVTRVLHNALTDQYEIGCRFIELDPAARAMIEDFLSGDSTAV
jgi:CheY-like chemotaxis protein